MKFKVGDKVRVCNPYSGSDFEDGDIVTIVGFGSEDDPDCYEAVLKKGDFSWYLWEDEVCAVTVGDNIRRMTDSELADKFLEFFIRGVSIYNKDYASHMSEDSKSKLKSILLEELKQPVASILMEQLKRTVEDNLSTFKSQTEVGALSSGDAFFKNGEGFIVLDKMPSGEVFVIEAESLPDSYQFGESNDWRESPVRSEMNSGKIYQHMCELFGEENICDMQRDLTSYNGFDDYGMCVDRVSMVTKSEYTKYQKILAVPSEDKHYCASYLTITPFSTPWGIHPKFVCFINSYGGLSWSDSEWSYGVRPVLTLSPSTIVSTKE